MVEAPLDHDGSSLRPDGNCSPNLAMSMELRFLQDLTAKSSSERQSFGSRVRLTTISWPSPRNAQAAERPASDKADRPSARVSMKRTALRRTNSTTNDDESQGLGVNRRYSSHVRVRRIVMVWTRPA